MRISELADASGVSVPTIKYYLREGLLPPGRKVSERLSEYDDSHVRRLRLLRVLRQVGDIGVDALRGLVDAASDRSASVHEMFGAACDALARTSDRRGGRPATRKDADRIVERAGWKGVRPNAPERDRLAEVLDVISSLGMPTDPASLGRHIEVGDAIAEFELGTVDDTLDRETMMERMVIGQVVFGELLLSLRRLAQEHYSAKRFA